MHLHCISYIDVFQIDMCRKNGLYIGEVGSFDVITLELSNMSYFLLTFLYFLLHPNPFLLGTYLSKLHADFAFWRSPLRNFFFNFVPYSYFKRGILLFLFKLK